MSEFLETPYSFKIPHCLHRKALSYILKKFLPNLNRLFDRIRFPEGHTKEDDEKVVQLMIDNSNHKLRMYGSAQELLENINIYENFPGNHIYFGSSREPYQARLKKFESLKKEKFIAKSDLLVILQNILLSLHKRNPILLPAIVIFHLKPRQESVGKCVEFVKFDEKIFEEMKNKIQETEKNYKCPASEMQQLSLEFSQLTMNAVIAKFEGLISSSIDESQRDLLKAFLRSLAKNVPREDIIKTVVHCYSTARLLVKSFQTIIDENLDMFLPRREDSKQPITVRVFEDGEQKFVMEGEFKKAIHEECEETNKIEKTISMDDVLLKCQNSEKNIEFICYPITRAKHRATPIQGSSGNFFILAIDYFFEHMRELIHGKMIFQKLKSTDLPKFLQNLNEFFEFDLNDKNPYFIQTNRHRAITSMNTSWQDISNLPAKEVRNVEPSGFTVQDLKNELDHLGLTTTFPKIQNYAEAVYSEVGKNKKESVLRTCDMFDAIEHCQLNCILEKLPELKTFVHNQKGCHRVYGFECEYCATENPENQEDQKLEILEKELEDLKIAHQKVLEENQQKSLEIQELQQKNLRLTVRNETNEAKMKQLTEKLAQSKLSIDQGNYRNACTSRLKIQCLICEKSFESGENQIIRCPLCKRRFHSKCAITWLKEHQQCPACNGDLPKN
ncbi:unnamed protein product [Caenorhabditis nigoni]